MKQRELTTEVVSVSDQRDAVMSAIESAVQTTVAQASKRGLFGTPSQEKINQAIARDLPAAVTQSLEKNIPVIQRAKIVSMEPGTMAAVDPADQTLEISQNLINNLVEWVQLASAKSKDPGQVVETCGKMINYLAEIIIHEMVHIEQQVRQPGADKDYRSYLAKSMDQFVSAVTNFASDEDSEIYLGSPQEIPAHAHQMVYRLISQALGGKKLSDIPAEEIPYAVQEMRDALRDIASGMSARDETLARYLGFREGDQRRIKVYRRFMKQVYLELQSYISKMQASSGQLSETVVQEIDYADSLQDMSPSKQQEVIQDAIGVDSFNGRDVMMWQSGPSTVVFFETNGSFDAVVYLEGRTLKSMKNYTDNPGLVYGLMHYIIDKSGISLHLGETDQLTDDGLKWIIGQIQRPGGFKIRDQHGQAVEPTKLKTEWLRAKQTGKPGPTSITISESVRAKTFRENESSLMPYDIIGVTRKFKRLSEAKTIQFQQHQKQVTETFDQPYKWKEQDSDAGGDVVYKFQTENDTVYEVTFVGKGSGRYVIEFSSRDSNYNIRFGITDSGDAFRVFATVGDILKQFVRDYQPDLLTFSALEKSRIKLYDRLAKMMPSLGLTQLQTIGGRGTYAFKTNKPNAVTESFDSPVVAKWQEMYPSGGYAKFTVGDVSFMYAYDTKPEEDDLPREIWIGFEDDNRGMGITGTGNAQQVFATVVDLTRQVLAKFPTITTLTFSAEEPSRTKLYQRIVKTLLPNWKLTKRGKAFSVTKPTTDEITESFDKPFKWRQTDDGQQVVYEFSTGKLSYAVVFDDQEDVGYELMFASDKGGANYGITGTGDAFRVFATVGEILKRFIRDYKPSQIFFSAAEPSRIKLYDRLATLLPQLGLQPVTPQEPGHYVFRRGRRKTQSVTESFDKPLAWRKATDGRETVYFFTTPNGQKGAVSFIRRATIRQLDLQFDLDGRAELTGKGEAWPIFATVLDCARDAFKSGLLDGMNEFTFSADVTEPSRVKLYRRLAQQLSPPGFKFSREIPGQKYLEFRFERTEPLTETFDKPLAWRKRTASWGLVYFFDTPDGKRVDMSVSINGSGVAEIIFEVDGTVERTGRGEAVAIFATVIDCVKNALGDPTMERVWKIQYGADKYDTSRQKLYSRFAKILPQAGYEFVGTRDTTLYKEFEFVNPEKEKKYGPKQPQLIPPSEQIEESFDQPYPTKKTVKLGGNRVVYTWNTNDHRVGTCTFMLEDSDENLWGVNFDIAGSMKATGSGDAFAIFATVLQCFRDWLSSEGKTAAGVSFAADRSEPSRIKLYDRFAQMMPRFGFQRSQSEFNTPDYKFYEFVRAEQINETFNAPVEYNWISMGNDIGNAKFTVGDISYVFIYNTLMKTRAGSPLWINIMFNDTNLNRKGKGFGITGSGNAPQVFATVVQLIRDVLQKFDSITKIKFTAKEKSRRDLYIRMVKRLLPDWDLDTKKESGTLSFTVSKPLNEMSSGGTCSGGIATVSMPMGGVVRRPGSSILAGINTATATPNTPAWMKDFKNKNQNKKRK